LSFGELDRRRVFVFFAQTSRQKKEGEKRERYWRRKKKEKKYLVSAKVSLNQPNKFQQFVNGLMKVTLHLEDVTPLTHRQTAAGPRGWSG